MLIVFLALLVGGSYEASHEAFYRDMFDREAVGCSSEKLEEFRICKLHIHEMLVKSSRIPNDSSSVQRYENVIRICKKVDTCLQKIQCGTVIDVILPAVDRYCYGIELKAGPLESCSRKLQKHPPTKESYPCIDKFSSFGLGPNDSLCDLFQERYCLASVVQDICGVDETVALVNAFEYLKALHKCPIVKQKPKTFWGLNRN